MKYRESKESHNAEKTVTQYEKMHQVCLKLCYMNSARYPVDVPRYSKSINSYWTDAASSGSNWNQPSPLSAAVEFTKLCRCGRFKTHNIILLIFASVIRVLLVFYLSDKCCSSQWEVGIRETHIAPFTNSQKLKTKGA
jgi:hypothetical protein